jgi:outer membrane immunogenic protein
MRKIIRFGLAAAFGCLATNLPATANAADLPSAIPVKAPVLQPAPDWSGFYVGLGVGMRSTEPNVRVNEIAINGVEALNPFCAVLASLGGCVTGQPLNDTALRANFYSGFNWQIAPQWVVGIEGDYGYADKTTTLRGMEYPVTPRLTGSAADSFSVKTTWDASARARIGYLPDPSVLLYTTGGAAWLQIESNSTCNISINALCSPPAGSGPFSITNSTTRLGWTAGAGIEAMLSPNWVARGEYRYSDFGTISSRDTRLVVGGVAEQVVSYDLHMKTHTATFGIAYKFGGSAMASMAYLPPAPATATSWEGIYAGLGLGARSTHADAMVTSFIFNGANDFATTCNFYNKFNGGCVTGAPFNGTTYRINPYAGYNWQVAPQWVLGIEGDWGFADKQTTLAGMSYPLSGIPKGRASDSFSVGTKWDASLRARAGYVATPSVLVYATGGAAVMHVESTSTCGTAINAFCQPNIVTGPLVITHSKTRLGWTAGGGLETMLGSNWLARAEYRYADFGTYSNTDVRTGGLGKTAGYDLHVRTHTALLGIGYKFDSLMATR